jgi:hypothetical protein
MAGREFPRSGRRNGKTRPARGKAGRGLFPPQAALASPIYPDIKHDAPRSTLRSFLCFILHFCYFLHYMHFHISCYFLHFSRNFCPLLGYYPDMANSAPRFFLLILPMRPSLGALFFYPILAPIGPMGDVLGRPGIILSPRGFRRFLGLSRMYQVLWPWLFPLI